MATKSVFKRFDAGTSTWVEFYFRTSADIIDETTSFKVMTAAERTAISTYLTGGFNAANKLLQLDGSGLIPAAQIPTNLTAYLKTANPAFTGNMTGGGNISVDGDLNALWNNAASTFQFQINDSQEGFIMSSEGGATLTMDQGAAFNRAVTVGAPTAGGHATTKTYVDGLIAEGVKPFAPVKAASTANIATLSGLAAIDGYTPVAGERVLLKNQTTASQNGIYTVSATAWTKVTAESILGALVFVENGTVNNDSKFYSNATNTWILFSRTDTITASTGLEKVGVDIRVATGGITNAMIAANTVVLADKTASFVSLDTRAYSATTAAATSANIVTKIGDIFSAIKNLRGTANYNTDNAITIASVNTLAAAKNQTFTGSAATPTGTFVTGDLYFQTL